MSEYIEIETEMGEDPAELIIHTNLRLADQGLEEYWSPAEMEEGSPLAQALSPIEGLASLRIEDQDLVVRRDLLVDWHLIVSEINAALKDFFL
jgi:hypothetical protein